LPDFYCRSERKIELHRRQKIWNKDRTKLELPSGDLEGHIARLHLREQHFHQHALIATNNLALFTENNEIRKITISIRMPWASSQQFQMVTRMNPHRNAVFAV